MPSTTWPSASGAFCHCLVRCFVGPLLLIVEQSAQLMGAMNRAIGRRRENVGALTADVVHQLDVVDVAYIIISMPTAPSQLLLRNARTSRRWIIAPMNK
jgi:hypothetical protein